MDLLDRPFKVVLIDLLPSLKAYYIHESIVPKHEFPFLRSVEDAKFPLSSPLSSCPLFYAYFAKTWFECYAYEIEVPEIM